MKKSDLLTLLSADEIQACFALLGQAVQALQRNDLQQELVLLNSQYENYLKEERSGAVSRDNLRQTRNQVKQALLSFTDALPDDLPIPKAETPAAVKLSGITEDRFKRQIFFFMLAAKAWIVYWVLFHKSSGGFSNGEAIAAIALLLPAFTAYTTVMLGDIIHYRHKPAIPKEYAPRVNQTLQTVTWIVFPVYALALHWIIGEKAAGALADEAQANYGNMTAWLAIVESAFGVYVGQIINAVFKSEK